MLPAFIVPDIESSQSGEGPVFDLGPASGKPLRLTLGITRIIERENLNISIYASADGENWEEKPLLAFPKKSYCGTYAEFLDLTARPAVRFLRATWRMDRWDRRERVPLFDFFLKAEVAQKAAAAS